MARALLSVLTLFFIRGAVADPCNYYGNVPEKYESAVAEFCRDVLQDFPPNLKGAPPSVSPFLPPYGELRSYCTCVVDHSGSTHTTTTCYPSPTHAQTITLPCTETTKTKTITVSEPAYTKTKTVTVTDTSTKIKSITLPVTKTDTVTVHKTATITGTVTDKLTGTITDTILGTVTDTILGTVTDTVVNTATDTIVNTETNTIINTETDTIINTVIDTITGTVTLLASTITLSPTTVTVTFTPTTTSTTSYTGSPTCTPAVSPPGTCGFLADYNSGTGPQIWGGIAASFDACALLCAGEPTCVSFEYDHQSSSLSCVLFNKPVSGLSITSDPASSLDFFDLTCFGCVGAAPRPSTDDNCSPSLQPPPQSLCAFNGLYAGGNLFLLSPFGNTAASLGACIQQCLADSACESVSYDGSNCGLFSMTVFQLELQGVLFPVNVGVAGSAEYYDTGCFVCPSLPNCVCPSLVSKRDVVRRLKGLAAA